VSGKKERQKTYRERQTADSRQQRKTNVSRQSPKIITETSKDPLDEWYNL
jgi:hypothetical protein